MSQYEQENQSGRGGRAGEVDDETMDRAWETAEERRGGGGDAPAEGAGESEQEGPGPWAKTSSGDVDEV